MHNRKLFTSIHGCVRPTVGALFTCTARRGARRVLSTLKAETPGEGRTPEYIHHKKTDAHGEVPTPTCEPLARRERTTTWWPSRTASARLWVT